MKTHHILLSRSFWRSMLITLLASFILVTRAPAAVHAADGDGVPYTSENLIRAVNTYAWAHGYGGGFPTFNHDFYTDGTLVYGTVLFSKQSTDFQDIPASMLDTSSDVSLVRSVNRYAVAHNYAGGLPTFFNKDYHDGRGVVYGALLLKWPTATWEDISWEQIRDVWTKDKSWQDTIQIGDKLKNGTINDTDFEDMVRAMNPVDTNDVIFIGGFPNFETAEYIKNQRVYGALLISSTGADLKVTPAADLGIIPPDYGVPIDPPCTPVCND